MADEILETLAAEATLIAEPEAKPVLKGTSEMITVTIAGPGRVGQAMGKLLRGAGYRIGFVAARRLNSARRATAFIGEGTPCRLSDPLLAEPAIILLTVSDAAISLVVPEWAKWKGIWRNKVVLHTSGALPASVLAPLKKLGASIGSIHPFQTVPSPAVGCRNLRGAIWAVEGDSRARTAARQMALALEGLPFRIEASRKALYHAAAVISCGSIVALLDQSERLLRLSGVPAKIIRPMLGQFVAETVRNFAAMGGRGALTGPAARGDWNTVEKHMRIIRQRTPHALPLYRELVRAMAKLAGKRLPPRFDP